VIFKVSSFGVYNGINDCLGMCGEPGLLHFTVEREIGGKNTNRWGKVYESPKLMPEKNSKEVSWRPHKIRLTKLANGDPNTRLKFRFLNEELRDVGFVIASSRDLSTKKDHKLLKGAGSCTIDFQMVEVPGFIDYLKSGWQISFAVAIDFTASNGNP
jgi:hypothetical protein